MNDSVLSKSRNHTGAASVDKALAGQEVSKGTLTGMGVVAGIIGIWALACFIGAMISSGGPIALARGWIAAVTGI
jgi:hypothetical protein